MKSEAAGMNNNYEEDGSFAYNLIFKLTQLKLNFLNKYSFYRSEMQSNLKPAWVLLAPIYIQGESRRTDLASALSG